MPVSSWTKLYGNRRMAALLGIGFAAGLPLYLTSRTLRLWARREQVDLASIGLLGLVTLPYAYKFIWAPLLDRFDPPVLGRRRGWILISQVLLMAAIAGLAFNGPTSGGSGMTALAALALLVAFLSATQDIVADAYRTDVLPPRELGPGASIYTTGYRLALLATGAGAVYLANHLSWRTIYVLAAGLMPVGIVSVLCAPEPNVPVQRPASFRSAVLDPFREFIHRNRGRAVFILLFIFLFKLPDYMAASMSEALLVDLGFSDRQISLWSLALGTAATIPGALLGGAIVTRIGLLRSLLIFGLAQTASNAGYFGLAYLDRADELALIAMVAIEYFCAGLVAAGFVAFLMSQCDRRFSATQFALLSSLMGLCSSLAGVPSGYLASSCGYTLFFLISIAAGLPGLALLPLLRTTIRINAEGESDNAAPETDP